MHDTHCGRFNFFPEICHLDISMKEIKLKDHLCLELAGLILNSFPYEWSTGNPYTHVKNEIALP